MDAARGEKFVFVGSVNHENAELAFDEKNAGFEIGAGLQRQVDDALDHQAERQSLMVAEREAIAAAAVKLVVPNDILMIGGGATTLHFARRLAAERNHLTVITHAFSIAMALASGLTAEGPSDAGIGPGLVYGAMMRRSAQTIILADHAKFDRPSLAVYGP
jgi:DeoR/GlpR family transcriptional regulator of sugar metabolism